MASESTMKLGSLKIFDPLSGCLNIKVHCEFDM